MDKKFKKTPQQVQFEKEQQVAQYQITRKEKLIDDENKRQQSIKDAQQIREQARQNKEDSLKKDKEKAENIKKEILNVLGKAKGSISKKTQDLKESFQVTAYQAPEDISPEEYDKLSQEGDPELGRLSQEIEKEDFQKELKRRDDEEIESSKIIERKKRRDARDEEVRLYRENEKIRLDKEEEEKKEKNKVRVKDAFFGTGFTLDELNTIAEFKNLDDGKKMLVLEEIRQMNANRIREEAEMEVETTNANLPLGKKIINIGKNIVTLGTRTDFLKNKKEKELANKLLDASYKVTDIEDVRAMASRLDMLDIRVDPTTRKIDFSLSGFEDLYKNFPDFKSKMDNFNNSANLLVNTKEPRLGMKSTKKEQEAYESALSVYEFQKAELVKEGKKLILDAKLVEVGGKPTIAEEKEYAIEAEYKAMLRISEIDASVKMLNYIHKYSDAAKILEDVANSSMVVKTLGLDGSFKDENQAAKNFAMGVGVRSVRGLAVKALGGVGTTLGATAIPAFVLLWGGVRGYMKGKQIINKAYKMSDNQQTYLEKKSDKNKTSDPVLRKLGDLYNQKHGDKLAAEYTLKVLTLDIANLANNQKEILETKTKIERLKNEIIEINKKIKENQADSFKENKKIDTIIDADSQINRINYLINSIENFPSGDTVENNKKKAELLDTLSARISYVTNKEKENKINFGKDNPTGAHLALFETIGRAKAVMLLISGEPNVKTLYDSLATQTTLALERRYTDDEYKDKYGNKYKNINVKNRMTWLQSIKDKNDKSLIQKRADIKRWEVFKGASMGFAGYEAMHSIMEGISTTELYHDIVGGAKKFFDNFKSVDGEKVNETIEHPKKVKLPPVLKTKNTESVLVNKEEVDSKIKGDTAEKAPVDTEDKPKIVQKEEAKDIKEKTKIQSTKKLKINTEKQLPVDTKLDVVPIDQSGFNNPEESSLQDVSVDKQVPADTELAIEEIKPKIAESIPTSTDPSQGLNTNKDELINNVKAQNEPNVTSPKETYQQRLDREYMEEGKALPQVGVEEPIGPEAPVETVQKPIDTVLELEDTNDQVGINANIEDPSSAPVATGADMMRGTPEENIPLNLNTDPSQNAIEMSGTNINPNTHSDGSSELYGASNALYKYDGDPNIALDYSKMDPEFLKAHPYLAYENIKIWQSPDDVPAKLLLDIDNNMLDNPKYVPLEVIDKLEAFGMIQEVKEGDFNFTNFSVGVKINGHMESLNISRDQLFVSSIIANDLGVNVEPKDSENVIEYATRILNQIEEKKQDYIIDGIKEYRKPVWEDNGFTKVLQNPFWNKDAEIRETRRLSKQWEDKLQDIVYRKLNRKY